MREIQSLARGLKIMDILINSNSPQSVTSLAAELEIDKSSASRLVRTLENYGYVQQAKDSRAYTVGKRMFTVGWQLTNRYALRETAKPYLDFLAAKTGECAHIGVYSSGKALVTDDVQSETSLLRVSGNSGRSIYLHNTAVGKCLLAHGDYPLPQELPFITEKTITTEQALETELADIRNKGYALDDEENESGVRCIASPVFDTVGIIVAAIGISGPTVRVTDETIEPLTQIVINVAQQLSAELGYERIRS